LRPCRPSQAYPAARDRIPLLVDKSEPAGHPKIGRFGHLRARAQVDCSCHSQSRSSTAALKEIAGQYTLGAIQRLASIMNNPRAPYQAQVAAAAELLNRGHGRPHQTQDIAVTEGQHYVRAPSKVSDEEWKATLERRQAELVALVPRPKPALAGAFPYGRSRAIGAAGRPGTASQGARCRLAVGFLPFPSAIPSPVGVSSMRPRAVLAGRRRQPGR
jgi:hypothetical protein